MLKNYLKIMIRNAVRHKNYSLINIAGLATGMACALLILLWVQDELSYDRYHKKADRIYRIVDVRQEQDQVTKYPSSSFGVAPLLRAEFKEEITPVRFFRYSTVTPLISYQDKRFFENQFLLCRPQGFAHSNLFSSVD